MVSDNKRVNPRKLQFIRFFNTIQKLGNEPAIDELDDTLSELVPPVRAGSAESDYDQVD